MMFGEILVQERKGGRETSQSTTKDALAVSAVRCLVSVGEGVATERAHTDSFEG